MAVVNDKKKVQTGQQIASTQQVSGGQNIVDGKTQGYKPTTGGGKPTQNATPYSGLTGVSANTAQQIAQAQQGYQSPYSGMLNGILQQITNPQEFKYEFNKDNLFQAYQDLYTQQGRQASLDAQGQAAGLTGGYGNSYGAAVGNQAYQQWLTKLYDKGLELYDRARQRYNDDWNQLLGQYDVLNGQDQQGYQQWLNNLNYWTGLGQTENQGYMNDQQLHMQQQEYALGICQQILANGHMPSAALLAQAGLSAEDAALMMAMLEPAGGTGGGPSGKPSTTTTNNLTGPTFEQATGQVQNNILHNNPNLPASVLNANLTGTVGDFVQNAINNLQNMPAHLANAITGNTGGSSTGKPNIGNLIGGSNALINGKKKKGY